MTRKILKILKFQNTKIKKFQNSREERCIPCFMTCENFAQKITDPQNDKKKIEDFRTSRYQNKIPSKFPKEKQIPYLPPCKTSHKKITGPQNDKKKIEDSKISKYKYKKLSKFT